MFYFGSGEVSVYHQAGALAKSFLQTIGFQAIANRRADAALPHNGIRHRLSSFSFPENGGFALVSDADSRQFLGRDASALHRLTRHRQLRAPDGLGIMFYLAGRGIDLLKFLLRQADDFSFMAKYDGTAGGGALVESENVFGVWQCGVPMPPLRGETLRATSLPKGVCVSRTSAQLES